MTLRSPRERVAWMLAHKPVKANRCAEHVMNALGAERQGLPDASAVYRAAADAGGTMSFGSPPLGVIHYWTGGSEGAGHVGIADGLGGVASVDVHGGGTVGTVPLAWFASHWPALKYRGWSWWWGRIDTQPHPVTTQEVQSMSKAFLTGGLALDKWALGKRVLLKIGAHTKPNWVEVVGGRWVSLAVIDLPKGGTFACSLQVRMPRGVPAAEARLARLGWGADAASGDIDTTGHNPIPAASIVQAWRTPIDGHNIVGGGPLAYQVYMPPGTHKVRFVAKAVRTS